MINGCCWSCDCTLRPWQDFGLKVGVLWHKAVRLKACHRWVGRRIMMQSAMLSMMFFYHWLEEMIQFDLFVFLKYDDNHQLFAGCCWFKWIMETQRILRCGLDYLQRLMEATQLPVKTLSLMAYLWDWFGSHQISSNNIINIILMRTPQK